jgi:hypothetical protein
MKTAIEKPNRLHDVSLFLSECIIKIWLDEQIESIEWYDDDCDDNWDAVVWDMDESGAFYYSITYISDSEKFTSKEYYKNTHIPEFEEIVKEAILNKEIFSDAFESYTIDLRPDRYYNKPI